MTLVGITGGIGSGKSHVARLIERECGIPVYDCDQRAKQLYAEDDALRSDLIKLLGHQIFDAQGQLNKPLLTSYLFASDENARRVDAIVHPAVLRDMLQWARRQPVEMVAAESAILFESGFHRYTHPILFVDAPLETRISRAIQRDGSNREQVEARIARQRTDEARHMADIVIQNPEGTTDESILRQCRPLMSGKW